LGIEVCELVAEQFFDVRKSVPRRNIERIVILPVVAVGFIILGQRLISDNFEWKFSVDTIKSWDGWAFVGIILICTGIFNLTKTAIFFSILGHDRGMALPPHAR